MKSIAMTMIFKDPILEKPSYQLLLALQTGKRAFADDTKRGNCSSNEPRDSNHAFLNLQDLYVPASRIFFINNL